MAQGRSPPTAAGFECPVKASEGGTFPLLWDREFRFFILDSGCVLLISQVVRLFPGPRSTSGARPTVLLAAADTSAMRVPRAAASVPGLVGFLHSRCQLKATAPSTCEAAGLAPLTWTGLCAHGACSLDRRVPSAPLGGWRAGGFRSPCPCRVLTWPVWLSPGHSCARPWKFTGLGGVR